MRPLCSLLHKKLVRTFTCLGCDWHIVHSHVAKVMQRSMHDGGRARTVFLLSVGMSLPFNPNRGVRPQDVSLLQVLFLLHHALRLCAATHTSCLVSTHCHTPLATNNPDACILCNLLTAVQLAIGASTDAGECQVWVGSMAGEPLPGAPFPLQVKPAAVCLAHCQVTHLTFAHENNIKLFCLGATSGHGCCFAARIRAPIPVVVVNCVV